MARLAELVATRCPRAPAAWLQRAARNLAIDALRREAMFQNAMQTIAADSLDFDLPLPSDESEIDDEPLRLLFLCCQPSIPAESQIALALKIVGGFSVTEIASGLLASAANIEKRLTRAKSRLREVGEELATLSAQAMQARLDEVLLLYLMFNEGFSASHGPSAIKRDVCDEAIRLTRMLVAHPAFDDIPSAAALLALMLMHSARFETRLDADECIVLLADQDRSAWNWSMVREAMHWMLVSARGDHLSRYHIEAAIAWEHCRAASLESTDWYRVSELYQLLMKVAPSSMVRLNAVIATSYRDSVAAALEQLLRLSEPDRKQLRPGGTARWPSCCSAPETSSERGNIGAMPWPSRAHRPVAN